MDLTTLVVRHRRSLVAAGFLGAGDLEIALLKLALVETVGSAPGTTIADTLLHDVLEDLTLPLSLREARAGLCADGFAVPGPDGALALGAALEPESWYGPGARQLLGDVSLVDLEEEEEGGVGELSVSRGLQVIEANRSWAAEISASAAEQELIGLPVFWTCGDPHMPLASVPGSMATTDALHLAFERTYYGFPGAPPPGLAAALAWLWDRSLRLEVTRPGWEHGAVALPLWDDDFVGTFDDTVDSSGCPTVDATGNAILAFATVLHAGAAAACDPDGSLGLERRTRETIADAVDCVLRWQADDGGWAIHRYEPPERAGWVHATRDLSTRYAIEGLSAGRAHVDAERRDAVDQALARARLHVWARAIALLDPAGSQVLSEASSGLEPLLALALLVPALVVVGRPDDPALPTWSDVRAVLGEGWAPDQRGYAPISFRVPTRRGPGDPARWELPSDPVFVTALLLLARADGVTTSMIDDSLARAIATILADELHGHWPDKLMEQEGQIRGMTGNSRHYHRAVLDFLGHEAALMPPALSGDARVAEHR